MKPMRAALVAVMAWALLPVAGLAGEAPKPALDTRDVEAQLAEARRKLDVAAREVAELSSQLGSRFNRQMGLAPFVQAPRALMGVSVDGSAGRDGARVVSVSPGGPAAEAGIKVGDMITSIAGTDLTKDSNPSRGLVETMGKVEPDQKIKVELLRDGRKMSFDVTPRLAPMVMALQAAPGAPGLSVRTFELQPPPNGRPLVGIDGRGSAGNRVIVGNVVAEALNGETGARFENMELATLSERLGGYFGVKAGVLVVRAGQDSRYKLQDGDVILAIDGRDATTAQHVGRILRSYQPGEKLTLRVQRDRKATNIDITVPGPGRG